jgi:hypothetical protein
MTYEFKKIISQRPILNLFIIIYYSFFCGNKPFNHEKDCNCLLLVREQMPKISFIISKTIVQSCIVVFVTILMPKF